MLLEEFRFSKGGLLRPVDGLVILGLTDLSCGGCCYTSLVNRILLCRDGIDLSVSTSGYSKAVLGVSSWLVVLGLTAL